MFVCVFLFVKIALLLFHMSNILMYVMECVCLLRSDSQASSLQGEKFKFAYCSETRTKLSFGYCC